MGCFSLSFSFLSMCFWRLVKFSMCFFRLHCSKSRSRGVWLHPSQLLLCITWQPYHPLLNQAFSSLLAVTLERSLVSRAQHWCKSSWQPMSEVTENVLIKNSCRGRRRKVFNKALRSWFIVLISVAFNTAIQNNIGYEFIETATRW